MKFLRHYGQLIVWVLTVAILAVYVHVEAVHTDRASYARCTDRFHNINRTNAAWRKVLEIERTNRFIDEDVRQARLKAYSLFILDPPHCGPKP